MKKMLFAVALLTVFATAAAASAPSFNTASSSNVITVNATIQQSASCSLTASEINFNVTDPKVATNGDQTVGINCLANIRKGGSASMTIWSSDLLAAGGGVSIPAASVLGQTTGAQGFTSLGYGAWNYDPMTYVAAQGLNGVALNTILALQLAPVPTAVPDQYTGTVTVLLQVQ